ncbi:MAG: serpin family protein [Byssovorax sp.]
MRHFALLVLLSAACAACSSPVPAASSALGASVAAPVPAPSASQATSAAVNPRLTRGGMVTAPPASDDIKEFATSNNAFAFDLFAKLRTRKGNLVISPFSLSTTLTMTWAGAHGETADQMKKVLHLAGTTEQVLDVTAKALASYQELGSDVTLRPANRLFGEKTYSFEQAYLDSTSATFGAPLESLDFLHASDAGRQHINAWVASATQDRIQDLIPVNGLDSGTRLVLANAIYFLGAWSAPFSKAATASAPFRLTVSESKDVPTMHLASSFRFAVVDGVKLLEMPYQGGALAMTLVLPDPVDGLAALEARLSQATLDAWLGARAGDYIDVKLPKLEIDPVGSLSLKETLRALGMPLAFLETKADFTGIAQPRVNGSRLYVEQVFHKAFIKVDEQGTEAAAATAVTMRGKSRGGPPKVEFHADHPFLFFLRDVRSGMILFMGRVSDPTAK